MRRLCFVPILNTGCGYSLDSIMPNDLATFATEQEYATFVQGFNKDMQGINAYTRTRSYIFLAAFIIIFVLFFVGLTNPQVSLVFTTIFPIFFVALMIIFVIMSVTASQRNRQRIAEMLVKWNTQMWAARSITIRLITTTDVYYNGAGNRRNGVILVLEFLTDRPIGTPTGGMSPSGMSQDAMAAIASSLPPGSFPPGSVIMVVQQQPGGMQMSGTPMMMSGGTPMAPGYPVYTTPGYSPQPTYAAPPIYAAPPSYGAPPPYVVQTKS